MTCTRALGPRTLLVAIGLVPLPVACGGDDGGGAPSTSSGASSSDADTSAASTETTVGGTSTISDTSSGADTTSGGGELLDEYLLEGDDMFPEGVAYDPISQAFFVGSLTEAGITRVEGLDGAQSVFVPSSPTATSSAGMKVDAGARRLWVCGSGDGDDSSQIYVYGIDDGALVETIDLGSLLAMASCNDLALDAEGAAYVTDPRSSSIHRIAVGGDASVWATDPEFAPELMDLGLNGIAVTPDDTAVIVTKFISKRLLRVAKDDPTQISEIALGGEEFAGAALIAGPDGIVFGGDVLYVVFDDVVAEVVLDGEWNSGEVRILTPPTAGLSTATFAEGEVYAVKSEVTAFALGTAPELPFRIVRVPRR
jgi:sugar lactone lactonase YvrE